MLRRTCQVRRKRSRVGGGGGVATLRTLLRAQEKLLAAVWGSLQGRIGTTRRPLPTCKTWPAPPCRAEPYHAVGASPSAPFIFMELKKHMIPCLVHSLGGEFITTVATCIMQNSAATRTTLATIIIPLMWNWVWLGQCFLNILSPRHIPWQPLKKAPLMKA